VNKALVSRSRVFQLKKLTEENLRDIALQAISDKERGYGKYKVEFEEGALEHLVDVAGGDARSLLNALELAVETTPEHFPPAEGERIFITRDTAEESIQKKAVLYDKEGDYHFDVISAFIKSLRGSDPDAALYWLSRMVAAGEDPRFIFRRMMISACEDVGLADPNAIVVVEADAAAFDRIGLPEGRFHLAHAALYLATCPKSNSTLGFFDALSDVEKEKDNEVPNHLKDASRDSEGFGHGEGYLYPHSYKDHWVAQQYLPTALQGKIYYKPSSMGYEGKIRDEVLEKREAQLEAVGDDLFQENLTFSPGDRKRKSWIDRAMGERAGILRSLVNKLYEGVFVPRHGNVLVLNGSHGLLLYPLMKMNPEGSSMIQVRNNDEKAVIEHFSSNLEEILRPQVFVSTPEKVFSLLEEGIVFSAISGRNVLSRLSQDKAVLPLVAKCLEKDGTLCLMEAIPSLSTRLSHFAQGELKEKMEKAEKKIYSSDNPLAGWGKSDLEREVRNVFPSAKVHYQEIREERRVTPDDLDAWWKNTYSKYGIEKEEYSSGIKSGVMEWRNTVALINTNPRKEKRSGDEHKAVAEKVKGL
ncbi:MAG: AAA family ATPase, partial [Candidatus Ornithospirochaeta sp.]